MSNIKPRLTLRSLAEHIERLERETQRARSEAWAATFIAGNLALELAHVGAMDGERFIGRLQSVLPDIPSRSDRMASEDALKDVFHCLLMQEDRYRHGEPRMLH